MKRRNRRFNSEKNAKSFAKKVNGEVVDLRNHPESKSNFKVWYDRQPTKDPWEKASQEDINEMVGFDVVK
ncbi:hypothetical protein [Mesonia aestuariivivens]|uniref:Uncharacterized protein n=1 Tax=Mesonia aestuariivivens TaxID=2796128 RepID=A0ABS6W0B5_9FLAO|nr:hypothetical protein [Mesonia aestuariivivens]MBW2961295.1 hypothetical protein [Mesonia aestuariivivens]